MAALTKKRRRAVMRFLPPVRCSATAKTTGLPCRKWANVGTWVCRKHGGQAPQVIAEAEKRISLAEALEHTDKRAPWDVMEDTLHVADVLMRQVLLEIKDKGAASPQLLDRLVSAIERANRLSKTVLDAGVAERRTRLAEGQAQVMHRFVMRVLDSVGLTPAQKALVPGVLRREIEGELTQRAA